MSVTTIQAPANTPHSFLRNNNGFRVSRWLFAALLCLLFAAPAAFAQGVVLVAESGGGQTVAPGATIPNKLSVRYDFSAGACIDPCPPSKDILFSIVSGSDTTGGATFVHDTSNTRCGYTNPANGAFMPNVCRNITGNSAARATVFVRLGTIAGGQVTINACAATVGTSGVTCTSQDLTTNFAPLRTTSATTPPPSINGLSVTSITPTTVRLLTQVQTNGFPTTLQLEIKELNASTYSQFPAFSIPANSQVQTVAVDLSGLTCDTSYQFRGSVSNNGGSSGVSAPFTFRTSVCPTSAPQITLGVSGVMRAGSSVMLSAQRTGGSVPVRFDWDVDNDGVFDRTSSRDTLPVAFPAQTNGRARVRATDASGGSTIASVPIVIAAPVLSVTSAGAMSQLCGDGDTVPEPGERWSAPVRIANTGDAAMAGGFATFVPKDRYDAANTSDGIVGKLMLDNPGIDVGNLAAGTSVVANLNATIATTASCGAQYGVLFDGGSDQVSFSPRQATPVVSFDLPPAAQCQVFNGTCGGALASHAKVDITPHQGLYLNSNRPGNGLSNFIAPGTGGVPTFFGAWFTAEADRTPTWYIVQGPLSGSLVSAPIYRFTRDLSQSNFTVNSVKVGQATIVMFPNEKMVFKYEIGTKFGAEQMVYLTSGTGPSPDSTGAWYPTSEGGWGQVIHRFVTAGEQWTFAVHYLYDDSGKARWVISQDKTAQMAVGSPTATYSVVCPGCAYLPDWADFPVATGSNTVIFTDSRNGRVTTSLTLPAAYPGSWVRTNLPITILTVPR